VLNCGRDESTFGTGDGLPKGFSTIWRVVCVVRRLFLDGSISVFLERLSLYSQNAYE
jgi:hypothetical protein